MKNIRLVVPIVALSLLFQIQTSFAQTATEFIDRAQAAQDRKDYSGMVLNASEAIKKDPNNAFAYYLRGAAYALQSKYAEAVADAAKAIEIDPKMADAYFLHGGALRLLRPDDWKIALADFDKAIELNPTSSVFFEARARVHIDRNNNIPAGFADADRAIALNPNRKEGFFERGRANQELKKWADAESDYSQAIKLGKNSARVYRLRAIARQKQGKRDEAIADLRTALQLDPKDPEVKKDLEFAINNNKQSPPPTSGDKPVYGTGFLTLTEGDKFVYSFNNDRYERFMGEAEDLFKKLTTNRNRNSRRFDEDRDRFGRMFNIAATSMNVVIIDRNLFNKLSTEEQQIWIDRRKRMADIRDEAVKLNLGTLKDMSGKN
jgi:tetratricopeptide (TPR) repeat protein